MIEVEIGTTGEIVEFPEGTPDWEITSAMRRIVGDKGADKSPIPYDAPTLLQPPQRDVGAEATDVLSGLGAPPSVAGAGGALTQALGVSMEPSAEKPSDKRSMLAESGIVTDKPAPAGLFESGLGYTDKDKAVAMEVALEEHFGKPVPVKPSEHGLLWLDPETNRWTLATKYGPDMADLKEHAATIGQIATEVVGGVAGLPLGPKGVIGGGVAAAYVSELARLYLGKAAGTNRNMTDADMVKAALVNSGLAYVGGKLGDVVLKLTKGAMNVMKGRYVPQEAVDAVKMRPKEVEDIIAEIQSKAKSDATPPLGKQSGDETLLRIEEMERKSGASEFGARFRERDIQNRQAAGEYLDAINEPFGDTPDSAYEFGRGLSQEAESRVKPRLDQAQGELDRATGAAQDLESTMPRTSLIRSGQDIRAGLIAAKEQFENQADRAYNQELQEFATENGIDIGSLTVPLRSTSTLAKNLDTEIGDIERLFPNLSQAERKVIATADEMNPLFSGEPLTFNQYRKATSFLKKRIRLAENQLGESPNDVATMKRLLGSLKEDYDNALRESGSDALIAHMKQVDEWYKAGRSTFDNDVVGELLAETKGGLWYVKDADVFRQVFSPGNHEVAERVASVLSDVPDGELAMQAVRREMMAEYRRQVFSEGKPIPGKHRQFMDEYEEVLRPFFTNSEWKTVRESRNLAGTIAILEKRNERIKGEIMNTFEYKLAKESIGNDVTYHNLFRQVWGDSKVGQIEKVKDILSGNRALLNQFKALAAKDVKNALFSETTQGTNLKYNSFVKYLDKNAGAIKSLFGQDYFKNLVVLREYAKMTQRTGVGANFSGTASALMDTLRLGWRAYVGPLSHTGYAVNKMREFNENTAQRILARVILEPQLLDDMIKASTLRDSQKKAAQMAGIIYMTTIDDEYLDTPDLAQPLMERGLDAAGNVFTPNQATEMMQAIPQ